MTASCPCGNVCGGNTERCANNVRFQALAESAASTRRASMHVVESEVVTVPAQVFEVRQ